MPNGGSDNCGTYWFNAKNKCSIRELAIEHSLYPYCSNHPYRLPDKDSIPIGPVFVATREGRAESGNHHPIQKSYVCSFWRCRLKSRKSRPMSNQPVR
jgi:hypothetical protein